MLSTCTSRGLAWIAISLMRSHVRALGRKYQMSKGMCTETVPRSLSEDLFYVSSTFVAREVRSPLRLTSIEVNRRFRR